jgi:hypothetical protein
VRQFPFLNFPPYRLVAGWAKTRYQQREIDQASDRAGHEDQHIGSEEYEFFSCDRNSTVISKSTVRPSRVSSNSVWQKNETNAKEKL